MQLSAVCAAATVSAGPARQTVEGCSLRLTLLTLGQHNTTNKAEANKKHTAMFAMLCHGVMFARVGRICLKYHVIMFSYLEIHTKKSL